MEGESSRFLGMNSLGARVIWVNQWEERGTEWLTVLVEPMNTGMKSQRSALFEASE